MSLKDEFKDRDYRRAYAEALANTTIATQIRLLRGKMNQKDFAALVGMKQSRISTMEDENYSSWSTRTLREIASACDVVFMGRFMSFAECLDWARQMSPETLTPIPFDSDPAFTCDSAESSPDDLEAPQNGIVIPARNLFGLKKGLLSNVA